jgi:hypothetical protein
MPFEINSPGTTMRQEIFWNGKLCIRLRTGQIPYLCVKRSRSHAVNILTDQNNYSATNAKHRATLE